VSPIVFSGYDHKRSELNSGDVTAFRTHLKCVQDGYTVSENYSEQDTTAKRKDIKGQIKDKQNLNANIKVIEDVQIPNKKQEKEDLNTCK